MAQHTVRAAALGRPRRTVLARRPGRPAVPASSSDGRIAVEGRPDRRSSTAATSTWTRRRAGRTARPVAATGSSPASSTCTSTAAAAPPSPSGDRRGVPEGHPHPPPARHHHARRLHRHRRHWTTSPSRPRLLSELAEQGDLAGIHFEGPFISAVPQAAPTSRGAAARPGPGRRPQAARRGARHRADDDPRAPNCPAASTPYGCSPTHGVIAAIGHTDATYEQTVEAIEAGATVATHLFNAMPALGHRAPGPIAALLEDERITVELINDGTHLHPAVLQLAFHQRGRGPGRVHHRRDGRGRLRRRALPARPAGGRGQATASRGSVGGRFDRRLHAHPGPRLPARGHRRRAAGRRRRRRPLSANPARLLGIVRPDRLAGDRARTPTWWCWTRTSTWWASCAGANGWCDPPGLMLRTAAAVTAAASPGSGSGGGSGSGPTTTGDGMIARALVRMPPPRAVARRPAARP